MKHNQKPRKLSKPLTPIPFNLLVDYAPYLVLLTPDDRQIMEMILPGLLSIRETASILNKNPGAISRKAALIRKRLAHPVAHAIVHIGVELAPTPYRVAIAHFLAGTPTAAISRDLGISRAHVRSLIMNIRDWANHYIAFRNPQSAILFN